MNSADSEFQFPWKQREILTFDIPVHDSERAGLGVLEVCLLGYLLAYFPISYDHILRQTV